MSATLYIMEFALNSSVRLLSAWTLVSLEQHLHCSIKIWILQNTNHRTHIPSAVLTIIISRLIIMIFQVFSSPHLLDSTKSDKIFKRIKNEMLSKVRWSTYRISWYILYWQRIIRAVYNFLFLFYNWIPNGTYTDSSTQNTEYKIPPDTLVMNSVNTEYLLLFFLFTSSFICWESF